MIHQRRESITRSSTEGAQPGPAPAKATPTRPPPTRLAAKGSHDRTKRDSISREVSAVAAATTVVEAACKRTPVIPPAKKGTGKIRGGRAFTRGRVAETRRVGGKHRRVGRVKKGEAQISPDPPAAVFPPTPRVPFHPPSCPSPQGTWGGYRAAFTSGHRGCHRPLPFCSACPWRSATEIGGVGGGPSRDRAGGGAGMARVRGCVARVRDRGPVRQTMT